MAAVLSCAVAILALPAAAQEREQDKWQFQIAPYLWVGDVDAETSLPQSMTAGSSSVQRFDTSLSAGFMLAAEARYRSVGVLVDFNWLQLNTSSLNSGPLNSSVDLKSDYIYSKAALAYTLPLEDKMLGGKFHAEVLAGARIWYVSSDFTLNAGPQQGLEVSASQSQTWVDPIIGANLSYDLTRHWLLLVRGTVGGFANDDLGYDVFAGPRVPVRRLGLGHAGLSLSAPGGTTITISASTPTRMASCWALYSNSERGLTPPISMKIRVRPRHRWSFPGQYEHIPNPHRG